jgi:hypothetical protein
MTYAMTRTAAACLALLPLSTAALAADVSPPALPAPITVSVPSAWTYRITAYAFLPWISGNQTVKGRTASVDTNVFRVMSDGATVLGLMAYGEARNGPLSLFADIMVGQIRDKVSNSRPVSVNPAVGGTLGSALAVAYDYATIEFGAAYEVARFPSGNGASFTAVDLLAGGRYWLQRVDLSFDARLTLNTADLVVSGNRATARSGTVQWVDLIAGARIRHQFAPGSELTFYGDIGGLGVMSQFTWQMVVSYSQEFAVTQNVTWAAVIGYRALYADYKQGTDATLYRYRLLQHGPVLGLSARF